MNIEELKAALAEATADGNILDVNSLSKQAIADFPQEAFGYFYQGERFVAAANYPEAQKMYAKAVELDENNTDYKLRLVFAAIQNEDGDTAEDLCDALLDEEPNNPEVHFAAAVFFLETLSNEDAKYHLDRAIELNPAHEGALRVRADFHFSNQAYDEALADINTVLQANPNHDLALHSRIQYMSLMPNPNWAAVADDYLKLLNLNPAEPLYYNMAGESYMHAGDYAKAEGMFDKATELAAMYGVGDAKYFKNRGLARMHAENYLGAMEDFRSVTDLDEKDADGYIYMAEARMRANDVNGAIGYLELGMDLVVDNRWKLQKKLGNIFMGQSNNDRAEGVYKQMLKADDAESRAEGCYCLGLLYHKLGNLKAAYRAWDKATQTMYHPQSEQMIEQYCAALVEADIQAAENELIEKYRPEFERNKKSPVLQSIFSKLWKVDEAITTQKNKAIAEIPDDIRSLVMEAFANMIVLVTDSGYLMFNPGRDSTRSLYRIVAESSNAVKVSAQPVTQGKPREMTFGLAGGRLILAGLGDEEVKLDLFFQESSVDKVPAAHRAEFKKLLMDSNTQYMGSLAQEVAKKL